MPDQTQLAARDLANGAVFANGAILEETRTVDIGADFFALELAIIHLMSLWEPLG